MSSLLTKSRLREAHAEMHGEGCVEHLSEWYVKVLEPFPDFEDQNEDYLGWMNCSVYALVYLWDGLDDGTYLGEWCCRLEDGVFCG